MRRETHANLQTALQQYISGRTLPQAFYIEPELFDYEAAHVFNDTWFFARHSSELPKPGDFQLFHVAKVTLILIRGQDGVVRAFHNTCTHRAAKLCQHEHGSLTKIVCPYHAWSFGIDGKLLAAPLMGESFCKADHGLRPALVAEALGLIFVNLDPNARPFDALLAPNRETLKYHGIDTAQVAARKQYVVNANWKLSVENFTECYHCAPSHRTLARIMTTDRTLVVRSDDSHPVLAAAKDRVAHRVETMTERLDALRAQGHVIPSGGYRAPLAEGVATGVTSGQLLLPPMTPEGLTAGTESVAVFEVHTGYINLYEDHAMILSYLPMDSEQTIIEVTWLINGGIPKPEPEVLRQLVEVWDITTQEDKWLTENTVAGVRSPHYQPGILSHAEVGPREFLDWYVARMQAAFTGARAAPHVWENWSHAS